MKDSEKEKEKFEEFLKRRIKREGHFTFNEWQQKATTHNLLWDIWSAVLNYNKNEQENNKSPSPKEAK